MNFGIRARGLGAAFAALALMAIAWPANAQEEDDIAASHLKAARAAISAIGATDDYDGILPQAAQQLKAELTQKNPDLAELIDQVVNENALELAGRRADLEREAAVIYARVFSEDELTTIADFYTSDAGRKLLSDGPIVSRELEQAARIWQRGVFRDLGQAVGEELQAATERELEDSDLTSEGPVTPAGEADQ